MAVDGNWTGLVLCNMFCSGSITGWFVGEVSSFWTVWKQEEMTYYRFPCFGHKERESQWITKRQTEQESFPNSVVPVWMVVSDTYTSRSCVCVCVCVFIVHSCRNEAGWWHMQQGDRVWLPCACTSQVPLDSRKYFLMLFNLHFVIVSLGPL